MKAIRVILAAGALCAVLGACATRPGAVDKAELAREVFELSGGVEDARLAMRYLVPAATRAADPNDARKACLKSFGGNPGDVGRAICDAAAAAMGLARAGQNAAADAVDRRFDAIEAAGGRVMEETYTTRELLAMKRFYSSPEGRSIANKRMEYWTRLAPVILSGG